MTTTPKTIGLPPEPPIGTEWLDHDGHQWRHEPEGWMLRGGTIRHAWFAVCRYLPLTLIEPDPWPMARTVAASVDGGAPQLLVIQNDYTAMTMTGALCKRDRIANVVPVTVVPVAEMEAHRASIKALGYRPQSTRGMPGSLLDTALHLLEATDALGVDLWPRAT